ncbi:hypothetical protein TRIP_C21629 [Candidatus Zixiibacteriota bacterium]|nr:hypothetical protein TRIP_C21629 [candidate division Zixibacteria bacterium]
MKSMITIIAAILLLLPIAGNTMGLSSARATAMGGAYLGLAKGVYAPLYNPANIGLTEYRQYGLELVGFGAQISNNSFTLDDYNKYTGAFLTDDDKSVILGKIPAEGLKVSADVEAGAMSLSLGHLVLSINGTAATEVNLGKDALELFLQGNGLDDTFSLDGMYSEAIAYASAGLSCGMSLYKSGTRQLAVGATYKYIRGFAYEKVTELHGGVATLATGFEGEGIMVAQTAQGGHGYAVDLGASLRLSDSYTAGIVFQNILSNITWDNKTEEHGYRFQFDSLTAENMDDSLVVHDDYSIDIPSFQSTLPSVMRVGLANTDGKLLWGLDWEQGFRLGAGVSTKPRLAAGAEYHLIGFFPLRAGYSAGGGKGSVVSGGCGLDFSLFYLDLAVSNHSGLNFSASKGLHLAVSTGFKF